METAEATPPEGRDTGPEGFESGASGLTETRRATRANLVVVPPKGSPFWYKGNEDAYRPGQDVLAWI